MMIAAITAGSFESCDAARKIRERLMVNSATARIAADREQERQPHAVLAQLDALLVRRELQRAGPLGDRDRGARRRRRRGRRRGFEILTRGLVSGI